MRKLSILWCVLASPIVCAGAAESVGADAHLDAHGFRTHAVRSELQSGPTAIQVLLPDNWDRKGRYPVLYVLPVEAGNGDRYGNGLLEVKKLNLHNRHGLVCVLPTFADLPWYADHATDPKIRQETYYLQVVLPFVEASYGGLAKPEGRLLLGFSKSGWGAFSLLLRHPEVFGRAAAWDAPLNLAGPDHFGYRPIVGTVENFAQYRITTLLKERADLLRKAKRLALVGHANFRAHHQAIHELLLQLEIPHGYRDEAKPRHTWGAGWVAEAVGFLVEPAR
jgi:hypothetical protein